MDEELRPDDLLHAYAMGYFPMAEEADSDAIFWVDPPLRGQLSITNLHVPRRLRRTIRRAPFTVRVDSDFAGVIDGCATVRRAGRTWINAEIRTLFLALHAAGYAHSVECWRGPELVGGVYGLALGGAFFGESMFSRARDASKVALVHLVARLWAGGFTLLDTQFENPHLRQFGVYEIPRDAYRETLAIALAREARFGVPQDEDALVTAYLAMNQGDSRTYM